MTTPDPQAHEDSVRYLTYGCVFRLVDVICYDITDNNTTPMNDHLTNAHNLEKKMGHDDAEKNQRLAFCMLSHERVDHGSIWAGLE